MKEKRLNMQNDKNKIIREIAVKIVQDELQQEHKDSMTLSSGLPGICLLMTKMMEVYPEEEQWKNYANECIGTCVSRINEHGYAGLSMFSGLAGLGLASVCASENFQNYKKLLHTINEQIVNGVNELSNLLKKSEGVHSTWFDAIEGMSGILSYLLIYKNDNLCMQAIYKGTEALIALTRDICVNGAVVPAWYIPSEYQFSPVEGKIYPKGNFNTSLSHGIAGPLIMLSRLCMEGICLEGQEKAIEKIVHFYFETKQIIDQRVQWTGQIDFEEYTLKQITEKNFVRRDAWCYGTPGICYALAIAGKALKREEWISFAVCTLKDALKDIRGIFSPTFCHGYTGIYQVLTSMERILEKNLFLQEEIELESIIWDNYNKKNLYGFCDIEYNGIDGLEKQNIRTLLGGAAGVCLTLLEKEHPGNHMWEKAFLLG